jgi:hypothetical protein
MYQKSKRLGLYIVGFILVAGALIYVSSILWFHNDKNLQSHSSGNKITLTIYKADNTIEYVE